MNTSVIKATKHDGNSPKQKHVAALCSFSWESKVTVKNMLDLLVDRLRDNNWDVVFKTLIVIHSIMRDGCPENVFGYLALSPGMLEVADFRPKPGSTGVHQSKNIRSYSTYLEHKVHVFRLRKVDFAESRSGQGMRLLSEGVESGLLENVNLLQDHLEVLLRTKYHDADIDNHITLYCFKMLIRDLLKIFQCVNQGVISILKAYFDLRKEKATICLGLYRRFIKQTEEVIQYLDVARTLESFLQFTVPQLKHAPISLLESLEEYLKTAPKDSSSTQPTTGPAVKSSPQLAKNIPAKKDAMDFFASLDDELALQNYQAPTPNISLTSPTQFNSQPFGNPFSMPQQQQQQRSLSPFQNSPPRFSHSPAFNASFGANPASGNPFSQTNPMPTSISPPGTSNPFATMRGHNQTPIQPQSFANFPQHTVPNRNTMNPFIMNSFADQHLSPQPLQNNGNASSNPFPDLNASAAPLRHSTSPSNQPHSNDFTNLFSQHSFPTQ